MISVGGCLVAHCNSKSESGREKDNAKESATDPPEVRETRVDCSITIIRIDYWDMRWAALFWLSSSSETPVEFSYDSVYNSAENILVFDKESGAQIPNSGSGHLLKPLAGKRIILVSRDMTSFHLVPLMGNDVFRGESLDHVIVRHEEGYPVALEGDTEMEEHGETTSQTSPTGNNSSAPRQPQEAQPDEEQESAPK